MPTVTIGGNTGDDYAGVEDSHLRWTNEPDTNFGSATYLWTSRYNTGALQRRALFRFTGLSNIPASATVNDATIDVYRQGGNNSSAHNFDVHRMLRAWVEGQVTANDYATSSAWTTQGAGSSGNDYSATVASTGSVGTTGAYNTFGGANLDADVEDFIDGTLTNDGHGFYHTDTPNNTYVELTSDEGTDGQRPFMTVDYSDGLSGTLAATLADATLSATGELDIDATLATTLGAATLAATGELNIGATLSETLADATLSATGELDIDATLAVTLGDATLAATSTIQDGESGSVVATLEAATLAATGELDIDATLAVTLGDATLAGTAELNIDGAAPITLGAATLSAAAELDIDGALATTLGDVTLAATIVEGALFSAIGARATLENREIATATMQETFGKRATMTETLGKRATLN